MRPLFFPFQVAILYLVPGAKPKRLYKYMYEMQNRVIIGVEVRALSALRGLFLDARRTFFVCFFRYRARLPRPHPGRACPVACSRPRAAGVSVEVCQTG